MAWDDKIKNLPDARQPFVDMLNEPQTSSELTIMNVPEIVIPADAIVDLALAIREPSTEVPNTATIKVNGILYSEIDNPANLTGYTYWINYVASRIVFPIADAGKRITQLDYQNWGTQHRAQFYIDGYQSLRDIRTVAQKLFDSLEAFPNFQIKVRAADLIELNTLFPAGTYEGADAYVVSEKKAYRSTGASWIPYEDVTTGDPVPEVITVSPAAGQVNVALAANVEILLSQNMDGGDITTKFSLVDKNGSPVAGAFNFFDKNGTSVTSSSTKIRKMVFNPTTDLTIADSPYSIELLPCDNILGIPMVATYTSDFSCASDMLPKAATVELVTIRGTSAEIDMTAEGSDYEGPVFYDVYLRNVTAAGAFATVAGHQGLSAADFPRSIEGLIISTDYEIKVKTRDNAGQTVDSNVLPFKTTGVSDLTPSAPAVQNINISNITPTGYTVQLATANQPTDPDNPEAVITFDIAEGTTSNILATGVTASQINAGKALTIAHAEGASVNVYLRAVSSTSGAGSWSTVKNFSIPTNATPTVSGLSATGITSSITYKGSISDAENNTITGLKIQRRPAGGADWVIGMVEVTYESTDGTEPTQVASFKSTDGLSIAGIYTSGDYDYRVCARDAGSGAYGSWVESLKASGGGFAVIDILENDTLVRNSTSPVFDLGTSDSFDSTWITGPAPVYKDGKVYMAYGAKSSSSVFGIGIAVSSDISSELTLFTSLTRIANGLGGVTGKLFDATVAGKNCGWPTMLFDTGDSTWKMWYRDDDASGAALTYAYCSGDPTVASNWTKHGKVMGSPFNGNPKVIKTGGKFYLFYRNSTYSISVAESTDGITWTAISEVLPLGAAGTWDGTYLQPAAIVEQGGSFYLYYAGATGSDYKIGKAKASAITGPYSRDADNPIFSANAANAWESRSVDNLIPIVRGAKAYVLYGADGSVAGSQYKIGLATIG